MTSSATASLKLDPELKARVRRLAETRRRSQHWVMREAIQQYIDREEQREQLRQDALAAWAEYQSSGQHATAMEADEWLARLEAGEDGPPRATHD
jgi:predicted transcriptional regulator